MVRQKTFPDTREDALLPPLVRANLTGHRALTARTIQVQDEKICPDEHARVDWDGITHHRLHRPGGIPEDPGMLP